MMRVVLTIVLPLLAPTVLYVAWMLSMGRGELAASAAAWRALPWAWLAVAGAALAAVMLLAVVETGGRPEGTYVAPHVEHGTVVPGHVEPAPAQR